MKNTYSQPKVSIYSISAEHIIATSDTLSRGKGSGGNTAETKAFSFEYEEDEE